MKKLSLTKYITSALKFFIPFVFIGVFGLVLWIADALSTETFVLVVGLVNVMVLFLPSVYYFAMCLVFKKKCEEYTAVEGVVANWELGFLRGTGSIIIIVDDKEYSTSAYFSCEEAKDLVGKTVFYAIIDETLFIYGIKE